MNKFEIFEILQLKMPRMSSRALRCKNCPVPFNSYVYTTEELGRHMKRAHNIVTFSVGRDVSGTAHAVVEDVVGIGAPQAETNAATKCEAISQGEQQRDAHGGYEANGIVVENINGMGILPLLLGEDSSRDMDMENHIAGEEHKSPHQKKAVPNEDNSKKYKCAKSGCGFITNNIVDMVTHKKNHTISGQLQHGKTELPIIASETDGGNEPSLANTDIVREDQSEKSFSVPVVEKRLEKVSLMRKKRPVHESDNVPSVKKIKVMRRGENLPGLKCELCPNMNYSFVTASGLLRHFEEIHEGQYDGDQDMAFQGQQELHRDEEKEQERSDVCPPLQIMTVSSSTPKDEVPKQVPQNIQVGSRPSLQVQPIPIINFGQQQPETQQVELKSCSTLIVSTTLEGLLEKEANVLRAEATAHNVHEADR